MEKSKWQMVCEYFNSHLGKEVTRRQFHEDLGYEHRYGYTTLDTYRKVLEEIGYLHKLGPGKYIVTCSISENLTSTRARELAYPKKNEKPNNPFDRKETKESLENRKTFPKEDADYELVTAAWEEGEVKVDDYPGVEYEESSFLRRILLKIKHFFLNFFRN